MERLIVTGVDYPLGANLAVALSDRFEVLGVHGEHPVKTTGVRTEHCAAADLSAARRLAADWRPRWIIHCPPCSAPSWDDVEFALAPAEEAEAANNWTAIARDHSAQATVLVSDAVFAGPRMFHEEASAATNPAPRAERQRMVERALANSEALVARTFAYGLSPVKAHAGFAERGLDSLLAGKQIAADGLRHATPILASDLADLLIRARELRMTGLAHLSGAERTSPFRFVAELAAACGIETRRQDAAIAAGVSTQCEETSLSSRRARRLLEMSTPLLREGLNRFAEQALGAWRDRWFIGDSTRQRELAA